MGKFVAVFNASQGSMLPETQQNQNSSGDLKERPNFGVTLVSRGCGSDGDVGMTCVLEAQLPAEHLSLQGHQVGGLLCIVLLRPRQRSG